MKLEKIYSPRTNEVTHVLFNPNCKDPEFLQKESLREDLISENEFLQCAFLKLAKNQTFAPHTHPSRKIDINTVNTQEAWCILSGSVEAELFDIDDNLIVKKIVTSGAIVFTLRGGHTYTALTNDTLVYEFKTGPYFGPEVDKKPIIEKMV